MVSVLLIGWQRNMFSGTWGRSGVRGDTSYDWSLHYLLQIQYPWGGREKGEGNYQRAVEAFLHYWSNFCSLSQFLNNLTQFTVIQTLSGKFETVLIVSQIQKDNIWSSKSKCNWNKVWVKCITPGSNILHSDMLIQNFHFFVLPMPKLFRFLKDDLHLSSCISHDQLWLGFNSNVMFRVLNPKQEEDSHYRHKGQASEDNMWHRLAVIQFPKPDYSTLWTICPRSP